VAPNVNSTSFASLPTTLLWGGIETATHFLPRLEDRDCLFGDGNDFARTRISSRAGTPLPHRKTAEAANLGPATLSQGISNSVEDRIYDLLDVTLIHVRILLTEPLNQFGLDHFWRKPLI